MTAYRRWITTNKEATVVIKTTTSWRQSGQLLSEPKNLLIIHNSNSVYTYLHFQIKNYFSNLFIYCFRYLYFHQRHLIVENWPVRKLPRHLDSLVYTFAFFAYWSYSMLRYQFLSGSSEDRLCNMYDKQIKL